ncbi:hypothetical protein CGRA01v4_05947 [Colletotrichum graminicola]|uniref:Uncharacterized protein n=1 Tax=Colletotrichum graminicola (strain M1.001 / M2 / FGSC 10212) TaxID=645133 RepID=E3QNM4_COLGM|nr:uncharacterized protein GLRG_07781 [Colletotrichum graminicola M1.001]EFQ32511.1 hypothetical protein GLRG_07781 [Colletotrichum graminicola M1.001]WDK14666.1 hypothetical protein CGRA01v4_05947 [Colletotrichum graminicola]
MAPASFERVRRAATEALAAAAASSAATAAAASSPTPTPNPTTLSTSTTAIVVVAVVLCAAAVIMSAALFYLFDRKKHAQFREACKRDPYLTRKEFSRRRKLSALERLEEEEMQRNIMIRKSLAIREPSRRSSYEDFSLARLQQQQQQQQQQQLQNSLRQEYNYGGRPVSVWMPRMRSASELSAWSSSGSSASSMRHTYIEPHPGVEVDISLTPRSRSPSPSPIRTPRVRVVVPPPAVSEMDEISSPGLSRPSDAPVHLS